MMAASVVSQQLNSLPFFDADRLWKSRSAEWEDLLPAPASLLFLQNIAGRQHHLSSQTSRRLYRLILAWHQALKEVSGADSTSRFTHPWMVTYYD